MGEPITPTTPDAAKEGTEVVETNEGLTTPDKQETVEDALARLRVSRRLKADTKEDEDESTVTDEEDSDETDDTEAKSKAAKTNEAQEAEALKQRSEKVLKLFPEGEEDAELAASIYNQFSGNEFKANEFLSGLEGISKKRVAQLKAELKSQVIEEAKKQALKELGLEGASSTDYQMFKRFLDNGGTTAMLGSMKDDDIPDKLKFDGDGNPRSDEEIEFFRDIKKQVRSALDENEKLKTRLDSRDKATSKQAEQKLVNDFSAERIASLDSIIDDLKLSEEDTSDFIQVVLYRFSQDEKLVKLWRDAVEAKVDDDGVMARKLSRNVDIQLTKLAEKVSKRFSASAKSESTTKEKELEAAKGKDRKEISESGGASISAGRTKFKINPNDPFNTADAQKQYAKMKTDGIIKSR